MFGGMCIKGQGAAAMTGSDRICTRWRPRLEGVRPAHPTSAAANGQVSERLRSIVDEWPRVPSRYVGLPGAAGASWATRLSAAARSGGQTVLVHPAHGDKRVLRTGSALHGKLGRDPAWVYDPGVALLSGRNPFQIFITVPRQGNTGSVREGDSAGGLPCSFIDPARRPRGATKKANDGTEALSGPDSRDNCVHHGVVRRRTFMTPARRGESPRLETVLRGLHVAP